MALEKAEELKSLGIACDLITGNEQVSAYEIPTASVNKLSLQVLVDKSTHISSTVEMTNLSKRYDVAVIDEAQLIGSEDRGWAWTQALLGLQAQKVFLCGSASMLPVVERICQLTKDRLVVRHFDRLSPLAVSKQAIHSLHNVQAGDCVVAFSRRSLYDLKKIIEKNPKLKCGMI